MRRKRHDLGFVAEIALADENHTRIDRAAQTILEVLDVDQGFGIELHALYGAQVL